MANEILKPSYFSILTADVRYDKELSASEKIFYSEITCLCSTDGSCYASNSYFSNLYGCDSRTIRNWITKLVNKKYINVQYDETGKNRKIYVILKSEIQNQNDVKKEKKQVKKNKTLMDFYNSI